MRFTGHHSKCIICLLYIRTTTLCSTQQMTYSGMQALLQSQAWLTSVPAWPNVNPLSCVQPQLRAAIFAPVNGPISVTKIQQAIRPHKDLLTIIKRCKLQWYGHVSHSSGPAKTILQGTVKGGKKTRQTEEEVGRQQQHHNNNNRYFLYSASP